MLNDDFYRFTGLEKDDANASAQIHFNVSHRIFEGHFPGQPVVPGVCMLELVKEMLSIITEKSLQLHKADNLKFLTVIDPRKNPLVDLSIRYRQLDNGNLLADAQLSYDGVFFFKCKGEWKKIADSL